MRMRHLKPSDFGELDGSYAPPEYTHMLIYNFPSAPDEYPFAVIAKKAKNQRFVPIHQLKGIKSTVLYTEVLKFHRFSFLEYPICRRHLLYDIFYFRIVSRDELIDMRNSSNLFAWGFGDINWSEFPPDDFILQIGYLGEDDQFRSTIMHGEEAKELYSKLTGCDESSNPPKQEGKSSAFYYDLHQMDWFDIA